MNLKVVTIRDGRTGDLQDAEAIVKGDKPLMARSKIFLDLGGVNASPDEIRWACSANGELDIVFAGNADDEREGKCWELGGQGLKKLLVSNGYAVIVKWLGQGAGTGSCEVSVSVGDESANVVFPHAD